jgi:hypothetical protein
MTAKYTKRPKKGTTNVLIPNVYQICTYTKMFHSKAFKNLPKSGFYTIWQPCFAVKDAFTYVAKTLDSNEIHFSLSFFANTIQFANSNYVFF